MTDREQRDRLEDAWIRAALDEELGGVGPPDLVDAVAKGRGSRSQGEGAAVPAAARRGGDLWWVAAAVLLLGVGVLWGVGALRSDPDVAQDQRAAQDPKAPPVDPVKVLLVGDTPGWDYRFGTKLLLRSEEIAAATFLCAAEAGFEQRCDPSLEPVAEVPRTVEALRVYDAVVFLEMGQARLGRNLAARRALADALVAYVRGGGGLALQVGANWAALAAEHEGLRRLLPAEVALGHEVPLEGQVRWDQAAIEGDGHALGRVLEGEHGPGSWPIRPSVQFGALAAGAEAVWLGEVAETDDLFPVIAVAQRDRGRVLATTIEWWRMRTPEPGAYDRLWTGSLRWLCRR